MVVDYGDYTTNVTGTYVGFDDSGSSPTYSVDIEWEGLSFTYYDNAYNETYGYNYNGWGDETGTITVTNNSEEHSFIDVTFAYTAEEEFKDANVKIEYSGIDVTEDVQTISGGGTEYTFEVIPDGTLPEGTDNATIGTITISISPYVA